MIREDQGRGWKYGGFLALCITPNSPYYVPFDHSCCPCQTTICGLHTVYLQIWSLLRLEALDLQVLGALRERSMQPAILQHFNRMDISLTFLTYARLGVRNLTFFDALANQTRRCTLFCNAMWPTDRAALVSIFQQLKMKLQIVTPH